MVINFIRRRPHLGGQSPRITFHDPFSLACRWRPKSSCKALYGYQARPSNTVQRQFLSPPASTRSRGSFGVFVHNTLHWTDLAANERRLARRISIIPRSIPLHAGQFRAAPTLSSQPRNSAWCFGRLPRTLLHHAGEDFTHDARCVKINGIAHRCSPLHASPFLLKPREPRSDWQQARPPAYHSMSVSCGFAPKISVCRRSEIRQPA